MPPPLPREPVRSPPAPDKPPAIEPGVTPFRRSERAAPRRGNAILWIAQGLADGIIYFPVLVLTAFLMQLVIVLATVLLCGVGEFLVLGPMICGFWAVVIGISRGEGASLGRLFDGFSAFGTSFGLMLAYFLLMSTFVLSFGGAVSWAFMAGGLAVAVCLSIAAYFVGCYLFFRLGFAFPLLVDRRLTVGDALTKSWRLTSGLQAHLFLLTMIVYSSLLGGCFVGILSRVAMGPGASLELKASVPVVVGLGVLLLCIWWACLIMPLAYLYQGRLPKIGFDVPECGRAISWPIPMTLLTIVLLGGIAGGAHCLRKLETIQQRLSDMAEETVAWAEEEAKRAELAAQPPPTIHDEPLQPWPQGRHQEELAGVRREGLGVPGTERPQGPVRPEAFQRGAPPWPGPAHLPPPIQPETEQERFIEVVPDTKTKLLPLQTTGQTPAPDYSHFACSRGSTDEALYVYESPPATGRRVAFCAHKPVWSADGKALAYCNEGVCVVTPKGTIHRRLATFDGHDAWVSWSPDGQDVLYGSDPRNGTGPLYSVSVDGSRHIEVLERANLVKGTCWVMWNGEIGLIVPAWITKPWHGWALVWVTPDGKRCLAFAVRRADGKLASAVRLPESYYWLHRDYHIAGPWGEGRYLSFSTPGAIGLLDFPRKRAIMFQASALGRFPGRPAVSPDGQWVAYYVDRHGVTIQRCDGTHKALISCSTLGGREVLAWSRDGRAVYVFEYSLHNNRGELWAYNWRTKTKKNVLGLKGIGDVRVDEAGCVHFSTLLDFRKWGGAPQYCWTSLEPDPSVVHVVWPRHGEIRLPSPAQEVSIAESVVEVEAETPVTYDLTTVLIDVSPKPLPTLVKDLPNQVLELGAAVRLPEEESLPGPEGLRHLPELQFGPASANERSEDPLLARESMVQEGKIPPGYFQFVNKSTGETLIGRTVDRDKVDGRRRSLVQTPEGVERWICSDEWNATSSRSRSIPQN